MSIHLFSSGGPLFDWLKSKEEKAKQIGERIDRNQFLSNSNEGLLDHCMEVFNFALLSLNEDKIVMDEPVEAQVDVSGDFNRDMGNGRGPVFCPGTKVHIEIPFEGLAALWQLYPGSGPKSLQQRYIFLEIDDFDNKLLITILKPIDVSNEEFKNDLESSLNSIRPIIDAQKNVVDRFIPQARQRLLSFIEDRRARLEKQNEIGGILGIPLKRSENTPSFTPIKVEKKITKPLPIPPKMGEGKPEPGIFEDTYQDILKIIRHWGRTVERSSPAVRDLAEEDLRGFILASLNCIFEGGATGETFSHKGKTDIFLNEGTKAAFIAECKIWHGEKEVLKAIDQLLKYPTWRDCKTALIFFNKEVARFSSILKQIPDILSKHPNFIENKGKVEEGEWEFVFSAEDDEDRLIRVRIQIFNFFHKK